MTHAVTTHSRIMMKLRSLVTVTAIHAAITAVSAATLPPVHATQASAFFDSLITPNLEQWKIPGMTVVLVSDTGVLASRGYGFADLDRRIPFDPDSTVIRIASVSKLFTGTAVMQLVERGRLSLDRDINGYLRQFQVEYPYGRPVTLRHLLTHTAGFDDRYIGKSTRAGDTPPALGEFLSRTLPPQILPPGEVCTYSNYSNALAGFVVESVLEKDFAEAVRERILVPLGMTMSGYRLREEMRPRLAVLYVGGPNRTWPLDFINDYPGGQMLSTGGDMARFMMAHLRHGELEGVRVLDDTTCAVMHRQHFTHHRGSSGGMAIAFGRGRVGACASLSHDGGYLGTSTRLLLIPELRLGLFIACNTVTGWPIQHITDRFAERFLPPAPPDSLTYPLDPVPPHDTDVGPMVGWYRYSRYAHRTMEKCGLLLGFGAPELQLWRGEDGTLRMVDHAGRERRMVRVEPLVARSIDDGYHVVFRRQGGAITHLFTNGTTAFEKVAWFHTVVVQRWVLGGTLVLLGACVVALLVVCFRDRRRTRDRRLIDLTLSLICAGSLLFYPVAFGGSVLLAGGEELQVGFAYGLPAGFFVVQFLPLLGIASGAALAATIMADWIRSRPATVRRVIATIVVLAAGLHVWLLDYWNLIGFRI